MFVLLVALCRQCRFVFGSRASRFSHLLELHTNKNRTLVALSLHSAMMSAASARSLRKGNVPHPLLVHLGEQNPCLQHEILPFHLKGADGLEAQGNLAWTHQSQSEKQARVVLQEELNWAGASSGGHSGSLDPQIHHHVWVPGGGIPREEAVYRWPLWESLPEDDLWEILWGSAFVYKRTGVEKKEGGLSGIKKKRIEKRILQARGGDD